MKVLPHRLRDGRCRDCGKLHWSSASESCCRCAVERYQEMGHPVMPDPVRAWCRHQHEPWRLVAGHITAGALRSGHFHVYIDHGDGGPLERPLDELLDTERAFLTHRQAHETGLDLLRRYPQVWVVTTVGAWGVLKASPPRLP